MSDKARVNWRRVSAVVVIGIAAMFIFLKVFIPWYEVKHNTGARDACIRNFQEIDRSLIEYEQQQAEAQAKEARTSKSREDMSR
jgi:hypothetical protein